MLDVAYGDSTATMSPSESDHGKGKGKTERFLSPFDWIPDFLLSLVVVSSPRTPDATEDSGFSEAVARVLGDLLQDFQHERFDAKLRAAAAQIGLNVSLFTSGIGHS